MPYVAFPHMWRWIRNLRPERAKLPQSATELNASDGPNLTRKCELSGTVIEYSTPTGTLCRCAEVNTRKRSLDEA